MFNFYNFFSHCFPFLKKQNQYQEHFVQSNDGLPEIKLYSLQSISSIHSSFDDEYSSDPRFKIE